MLNYQRVNDIHIITCVTLHHIYISHWQCVHIYTQKKNTILYICWFWPWWFFKKQYCRMLCILVSHAQMICLRAMAAGDAICGKCHLGAMVSWSECRLLVIIFDGFWWLLTIFGAFWWSLCWFSMVFTMIFVVVFDGLFLVFLRFKSFLIYVFFAPLTWGSHFLNGSWKNPSSWWCVSLLANEFFFGAPFWLTMMRIAKDLRHSHEQREITTWLWWFERRSSSASEQ